MSKIRTLIVALLAMAALAACGGPSTAYMTTPPAYGAAGHCYYVDSPLEVVALQSAGLCPVGWTPMVMPVAWRSQYAWYYDSPRYYNSYVPATYRTTYVTHVRVYESAHPQAVRKAPVVTRPQPGRTGNFVAGNKRPGGDAGTSRVVSSRPASAPSYNSRPAGSGRSGGFSSGKRR